MAAEPPASSDYGRGVLDGEIAARLAGHDQHFSAINGHMSTLADELREVRLAVQRLGDQAVSRDATVVTTAAALKDAEEARRARSDQTWSPWQKGLALLAGAVALVGLIIVLVK